MVNKSATSITFQWAPPSKPNGKIISYTINIKNLASSISNLFTINDDFYKVEGLKPFTKYELTISCQSEGGVGPFSDPIFVSTSETSKF